MLNPNNKLSYAIKIIEFDLLFAKECREEKVILKKTKVLFSVMKCAFTIVKSISNCVLYGSDYEWVIGICCFVANFYFYFHKKIEQSKR